MKVGKWEIMTVKLLTKSAFSDFVCNRKTARLYRWTERISGCDIHISIYCLHGYTLYGGSTTTSPLILEHAGRLLHT